MPNYTSDHLFDLVKSLSKSEKRFFKLYAGRHSASEDSNALLIFDFLAKMSTYDECKVLKEFEGKAFLNKFSIAKHRLYQQIIESLVQFNAKKSVEIELVNSLRGATILFGKGLHGQAKKITDSVLKKAEKYNLSQIKWQGLQLLKQLHEQQFYTSLSAEESLSLHNEESIILKSLITKQDLWFIKASLFKEVHAIGTVRSADQAELLRGIIAPLQEINIDNDTLENKYLYHQILGTYYFAIQETKNCYEQLATIKKLFETNTHFFGKKDGKYLSLLTNLAYTCIQLNRQDEVRMYLKELEEDKNQYDNTLNLEVKYFSSFYSLKLFALIEKGELLEETMLAETEEGLKRYYDYLNPVRKAYFHFKLGVYYLGITEYKKALVHINDVLNDKQNLVKEDIYSFAQILQLIIHFELKNHRFLTYALASTKRFLKGKNRLNKFESVFLKIITKIKNGVVNDIELQDILSEFQPEMHLLKTDKFEKNAFDYFDFAAWIDSKLLQKPYLEIKKTSA